MHRRALKMLLHGGARCHWPWLLVVGCGQYRDATTTGGTADTSVKTYLDPDYGYSFDYPAAWKLVEASGPTSPVARARLR